MKITALIWYSNNPKHNTFLDPSHLPVKHLSEITFPRKSQNGNYIILNELFPERALGRNYITPKARLAEIIYDRMNIFPKTFFPEFTLA